MGEFLALLYVLTALIWLSRGHRALKALQENPEVWPAPPAPNASSPVSILLPVKNEEMNLAACLEGLRHQSYPSLEIIVINDQSVDRTGEILETYARAFPDKLRVLHSPPAPPGWTGKNWALAHGAPSARGEWLLFTDADTRHEPWAVASAVAYAEERRLDLLTLSPRCLVKGIWEKIVQPAAIGFMALWFPFAKANDPDSDLVFGNGQFLMIRKEAYQTMGGHTKVKEAFLEDFALAKESKRLKLRMECAIGTKIYGTRMYSSFRGIWLGWRRIYLHALERNPFRLLTKAFFLFSFSFLPFFFFPFLNGPAPASSGHFGLVWGSAAVLLFLICLIAWRTHHIIGARRRYAFLHPLAGLVLAGILADAAWTAAQKKEVEWR